jgi:hypothetical protein
MNDLSKYRLDNYGEIMQLKAKLGEKFNGFQTAVYRLLASVPDNKWYDFRNQINPDNYEAFIKIVCHYIYTNSNINNYIEFNETFTCIRRKVFDPPTVALINDALTKIKSNNETQ